MNPLHINVLRKVETMLKALNTTLPGLEVTFKGGVIEYNDGADAASKRRGWGLVGAEIKSTLQRMPVGDVQTFKTPADREIHELQTFLVNSGTSLFGEHSVTTHRNRKTNTVEIMRVL